MNQSFIFELINRIRTEKPDFFKKLQVVAVILFAVSGALGYVMDQDLNLPHWFVVVCQFLNSTSFGAILTAFLPNKDQSK
jgi:TctA family transporter